LPLRGKFGWWGKELRFREKHRLQVGERGIGAAEFFFVPLQE
jgi:hypothetical protein